MKLFLLSLLNLSLLSLCNALPIECQKYEYSFTVKMDDNIVYNNYIRGSVNSNELNYKVNEVNPVYDSCYLTIVTSKKCHMHSIFINKKDYSDYDIQFNKPYFIKDCPKKIKITITIYVCNMPTFTILPTTMPTLSPTMSPTNQPLTLSPTNQPLTLSPTNQPLTLSPIDQPSTLSPTDQPSTMSPTMSPLEYPTMECGAYWNFSKEVAPQKFCSQFKTKQGCQYQNWCCFEFKAGSTTEGVCKTASPSVPDCPMLNENQCLLNKVYCKWTSYSNGLCVRRCPGNPRVLCSV